MDIQTDWYSRKSSEVHRLLLSAPNLKTGGSFLEVMVARLRKIVLVERLKFLCVFHMWKFCTVMVQRLSACDRQTGCLRFSQRSLVCNWLSVLDYTVWLRSVLTYLELTCILCYSYTPAHCWPRLSSRRWKFDDSRWYLLRLCLSPDFVGSKNKPFQTQSDILS